MKTKIKIKRWIHRFIYGKKRRPFPITIEELTYRYCKGLKNWKIKQCSRSFKYELYSSPWCLVSHYYPEGTKIEEGEIGANVLSKTRYVLKQK